jgi:hypothetical protein
MGLPPELPAGAAGSFKIRAGVPPAGAAGSFKIRAGVLPAGPRQ